MKFASLYRSLSQSGALARGLIAAVAVLITLWSQCLPASTESWFANEWLRDRFVRAQASAAPETRLVVIDIDEISLAELGPWPWPRARIATLLERLLADYGARGVALDFVFPEAADDGGDARMAALAQYGPLVLAQAFDFDGNIPLRVGAISGGTPAPRPTDARAASGYTANHAGLARAPHTGNIGFIPDQDGVVRRLPMQTRFGPATYPTLSLALLGCCAGLTPATLAEARAPRAGLASGDGLRRVPFGRQWDAYTVLGASDVIAQRVPEALLKGQLVLVGSSALGLLDRVATPLSASTSGMQVHAAALTALLDIADGSAPAPWPGAAIALLFSALVALMSAYTFPRLSALLNTAILGAASLAWLALAYLITPHDAGFSSTGPLASNLFLLTVAVPHAWQLAQQRSRQLLGTLRQYVADAVVDELLRSDLSDPLVPTQRPVTTLIADMEGYTGHVESLPVEQAAELTRAFLDCLTEPVLAARGTLDKYTGDGLVAFWGAPLPIDDHADLALDAALAIMAAMREFNRRRAALGQAPIRVRIGIESGLAMAGDFGSRSRSIYTAVGDSVNVASRLETAARDLPYDVIIGPGTAALTRRHKLLLLGETMLRGKEKQTTLYTLAALAATQVPA
jgi:adenylate cyclase